MYVLAYFVVYFQCDLQDLLVDRLVEQVDRLREEIAMYEAQLSAQSDETKAAKEALTEAYMEIDVCIKELNDKLVKYTSFCVIWYMNTDCR